MSAILTGGLAPLSGEPALQPNLFETTLRIEPTRRQIATMPVPVTEWRIAAPLAARFDEVLTAARFPSDLAARLSGRMIVSAATGEGAIIPDAALLDQFSEGERTRWWAVLGSHPANRSYRWPVAIHTRVLDRMEQDPAFVEAVRRVRRWGVPEGPRVLFADLFLLEAFPAADSQQRFLQMFFGADTEFVKIVADADDHSSLAYHAAYWQGHGRSRLLQPILSAIGRIEGHDKIDLAHLLPRTARSLLYTYPADWQTVEEPSLENASVAAAFFAPDLDPAPVLARGFSAWLQAHCAPVTGPRNYGDIVLFEDPEKTRWPFAMIHIADGIVFGRRPTLYGPWELLREAEVPRLNPRLRGNQVRVYRLRLPEAAAEQPDWNTQKWLPPAWPEQPQLQELPVGPWGKLMYYDVLLTPSTEVLERLAVPASQPRWVFHGLRPEEFTESIDRLDAPQATRRALHALFAGARPDRQGFITVYPSPELVLATPASFRTRFFPRLQHGIESGDYAQEISIPSQSGAAEWFTPELLPPRARDVMLRLTYPQGKGLMLSDYGTLYHALPDPAERLAALRVLYRTPALIILMERPTSADVPELVDYWRLGSQKSTLRLLESFAANPDMGYLDVLHLLPPLAREFMNVYLRSPANSPAPNCYWTALNFASDQPDSRLLTDILRSPRSEGGERERA